MKVRLKENFPTQTPLDTHMVANVNPDYYENVMGKTEANGEKSEEAKNAKVDKENEEKKAKLEETVEKKIEIILMNIITLYETNEIKVSFVKHNDKKFYFKLQLKDDEVAIIVTPDENKIKIIIQNMDNDDFADVVEDIQEDQKILKEIIKIVKSADDKNMANKTQDDNDEKAEQQNFENEQDEKIADDRSAENQQDIADSGAGIVNDMGEPEPEEEESKNKKAKLKEKIEGGLSIIISDDLMDKFERIIKNAGFYYEKKKKVDVSKDHVYFFPEANPDELEMTINSLLKKKGITAAFKKYDKINEAISVTLFITVAKQDYIAFEDVINKNNLTLSDRKEVGNHYVYSFLVDKTKQFEMLKNIQDLCKNAEIKINFKFQTINNTNKTIEERKMKTIKDLKNDYGFQFINSKDSVKSLVEYVEDERLGKFDSFYVRINESKYTDIYGVLGKTEDLNKEVYPVIVESKNVFDDAVILPEKVNFEIGEMVKIDMNLLESHNSNSAYIKQINSMYKKTKGYVYITDNKKGAVRISENKKFGDIGIFINEEALKKLNQKPVKKEVTSDKDATDIFKGMLIEKKPAKKVVTETAELSEDFMTTSLFENKPKDMSIYLEKKNLITEGLVDKFKQVIKNIKNYKRFVELYNLAKKEGYNNESTLKELGEFLAANLNIKEIKRLMDIAEMTGNVPDKINEDVFDPSFNPLQPDIYDAVSVILAGFMYFKYKDRIKGGFKLLKNRIADKINKVRGKVEEVGDEIEDAEGE